ncbi:MAG TPA: hypothetical protein VJK54_09230, partial [Chthoniobacterales bacterium]|nr:hypothetical protein [Chthoniobacterales bacterium]
AEVMFRDNETKEGEEQEDVMTHSEVIAAKRSEEQAWAACVAAKKNLQQYKDEFTLLSNKGLGKNSDAEANFTKAIQAETAAQVTYAQAVQSLEFCKDSVGKAAIFRAADRAWMEADAALVATDAAHAAKKASTAASQARQAMLTDAAMEAEARVQPALQRAHEAEELARIAYTQATEASYEEAMRQKGVVKGEAFWTDKCVMNAETAEQAVAELNRVPDHAAAHRAADRAEFIAAIDRIVKLQVTNALVAKEAKTAEVKRALEAKKILQSKMTTKEEKAAEAIINERREEVTRNAEARAVARREIMDSCSECPEKTVEYLGKAAYVSAIVVGGSVAVGTCPIWSPILLLHYCYNSDEWDSCLSSS